MKSWAAAFGLSGVGFYIAGCVIGGTVGGAWLDGKYSTSPTFLISGILSGIICAGLGVYGMIKPLLRSIRKGDKKS